MGRGGWNQSDQKLEEYGWEEIRKHSTKLDRWVVIDDVIYDVTRWGKIHPGGERILTNYAGEDATEAWEAFHIDKKHVSKFMKALIVGRIRELPDGVSEETAAPIATNREKDSVLDDFRELRRTVEDQGLFKASVPFFAAVTAHILLCEALGWWVLYQFGVGWVPYLIASLLLATAQNQSGWFQHDLGHLSVMKNSRLNHWCQVLVMNIFKGASADWWNYRHFNHHAKPNILHKDPDVRLLPLFLLGKQVPVEVGKAKSKFLPYNLQHRYWHLILPPFLLPIYFNYEIPYFLITRKLYWEAFWLSTFFVRYFYFGIPVLGIWGTFCFFFLVRVWESHWFVWVTQMSHIPMLVDYEHKENWVSMQLKATCNVKPSAFNNWFTGHLNYQIEHHLFPTLPRHSYHAVAPLVRSLCKKHGIPYYEKDMWTAWKDVIGVLKMSGDMWLEAYNM